MCDQICTHSVRESDVHDAGVLSRYLRLCRQSPSCVLKPCVIVMQTESVMCSSNHVLLGCRHSPSSVLQAMCYWDVGITRPVLFKTMCYWDVDIVHV
jgi:hypothetical protein